MKTRTVSGTTLYRVALEEYGDATQWNRIAAANGLLDPMITGLTTLTIPSPDPTGGNGGILGGQ
jgi:nucleoid-associated protein YgaU